MDWIRTYFFDASSIVKILIEEPGSQRVREIYRTTAQIHTSWVLIAEALGVLKRKWHQDHLEERQYSEAIQLLFTEISKGKLKAVDIEMREDRPMLKTYDVSAVRQRHPNLDAADALQFSAIRQGLLGSLVGESSPQLVTADEDLANAARSERFRVVLIQTD